MKNIIELTNENINSINYEDVIAVTIAECGAMGEPNGFYVMLKNHNLYHTNFGNTEINKEKLLKVFPLLGSFDCFCGYVNSLDTEWKSFYMGFGNYLIVREKYYKPVEEYIKNNLGDNYKYGELYQKWINILEKVCKI